ncbi:hypothetical protein [Allorhodopirellula heiligendammensis]|uniref:Uncharacterized protein n=1 Tax=Allorhodopirellula heiligendammensis TaxID=2714739 RepID=A0A5C6BHG4_9BACT|nr:hypothetical protein [Allorhodopirellula heiligendammensis]TWU11117.1 hypothetical protein Poly21_50240 [Allorhodopirellula heiligendammensis]
MNNAPYPQTLPQQLRELGERWDAGRLKRVYTTPIGRFVLCWMALVVLLQIGAEILKNATARGWISGTGWGWALPTMLYEWRYAAAQVGAVALVVWFQCRWPQRHRWGWFVGFTLGYVVFLRIVGMLGTYRSMQMSWTNLWPFVVQLFEIGLLTFFVRAGNVVIRIFLVGCSVNYIASDDSESASHPLPTHNSWSLGGMFLVVLGAAGFLAILRPTKELWAPSELFGSDPAMMAFWWIGVFLELLIVWVLAYAVAAQRVRGQPWILPAALVFAVAIPRLAGWIVWQISPPSGLAPHHWYFVYLGIDTIGAIFTIALLAWFFVACERSGLRLAMWIRGSDDAIPTP